MQVEGIFEEVDYDADRYLAMDEVLADEALPVLRLDALETPAYLLSRRSPVPSGDFEFSRRETRNAPIYLDDSSFPYSIIWPKDRSELAPTVFEDEIGPKLKEVFGKFHDDLKIDPISSAIRTGDRETPEPHASGLTLSGNALYGKKDAVLCQGVVNLDSVEPADYLNDEVSDHVEKLPFIEASRTELIDEMASVFNASGHLQPDNYEEKVAELVEEKYSDPDWIYRISGYTGEDCRIEKKRGYFF
jgi:lipoate-protein ligase A